MTDSALDSWLAPWRSRHPQLETAWSFLRADECVRFGAFEALKQEWLDAAFAIREPQIAAAKLQWWREELQLAQRGEARHPLTRTLFADEELRRWPQDAWNSVIEAALSAIDARPAANFPAQLLQAQPLQAALARIETALWFRGDASAARAQRVADVQHWIDALRQLPREVERGHTPLPMTLLARHGLTQPALAEDTQARRAALLDQIDALRQALDETDNMSGPLALFRGLQLRLDRRALQHAAIAQEPLAALQRMPAGAQMLLDTWRSARAWRTAQRSISTKTEI